MKIESPAQGNLIVYQALAVAINQRATGQAPEIDPERSMTELLAEHEGTGEDFATLLEEYAWDQENLLLLLGVAIGLICDLLDDPLAMVGVEPIDHVRRRIIELSA